ncbi:hypothetical protein [Planctomicrobium piriforme]|uniref:hypothetical protein n=1 Tax=Planctomicrobium piriforme TaxID=1576369 RepID=UPI00111461C0|nr:hypothetical protein [Planctomicrobium piriforme]
MTHQFVIRTGWFWPLLIFVGCLRSGGQVEFTTDVQAKSLLVSEVQAADDRSQLVDCPIEITNRTAKDQQVTLVTTGCACYGITFNGVPLEKGSAITVPAGEKRVLQFKVMPVDAPIEKDFTAEFSVSDQTKPRNVTVRCSLQTWLDLRVTPHVVTIELASGKEVSEERSLLIEHIFRGSGGESFELEFPELPSIARVESQKSLGSSEKLEDQLYRQAWEVVLKIDIPAGFAPSDTPLKLPVAVKAADGREAARSDVLLTLHRPQPIVFPTKVHFGKMPAGGTRSRRILLSSANQSPFQLSLKQAPPFVESAIDPEPHAQHWVELTVSPETPGTFSGDLVLTTDRSDVPEVVIRVEGIAEAE